LETKKGAATVKPSNQQELDQYVDAVIAGKQQPQHASTPYHLQKLQEMQKQFTDHQGQVQQTDERLRALREDLCRLDGAIRAAVMDIRHWELEAVQVSNVATQVEAHNSKQGGNGVIDAQLSKPEAAPAPAN
jgi:chromosome segregation ATPase